MKQIDIFLEVLQERGGVSEVSGAALVSQSHLHFINQFSHILPKGMNKRFIYNKRNIVLKTAQEHADWTERPQKLRDKDQWKWVFELEEKLREEYNALPFCKKNWDGYYIL